MIKKISIIACLMLGVITAQAQHKVISFFDEMGTARIQTEEFSQAHDTIVMVDHRIDDVIWARYVYRITSSISRPSRMTLTIVTCSR